MPELPEVESICVGLRSIAIDKKIIQAKALTNLSLRQEIPQDIVTKVINTKIIKIERRAKYIQLFLDNEIVLIIHLGMSGKLLIKNKDYAYQKHDHFELCLENNLRLIYNDPRRFGLILYAEKSKLENLAIFKNLGLEPLSFDFTSKKLESILHKKKQPIKLALMDNANIVGVGNIYAAESLFLSAISPLRLSSELNRDEISKLHQNIINVLKESIKAGGSTLKDYALVNGEKGYFQNSFYVYGRDKENCKICDNKIIRIIQAGRASFYCATCQV